MRSTVPFGRVAGIPIGAHWSVLGIAALISWTLAASVLPDLVPGESTAAYWAAGVIAGAAFFASLLAHELAHALVGQRHGVAVDSITLWLLGGVSRFRSEPSRAGDELRIAVAGPLTSFGLALGFGALSVAGAGLHLPDLVTGSLAWLSLINLMLGAFNLLPAYPLDGGRVLRAIVWYRHDDRLAATRTAARVGRAAAWVLIGLGMLLAVSGAVVSGLWLVLIGWFVDNAGRAEAEAVVEQFALGAVPVERLMATDPVVVGQHVTVDQLLHGYLLAHPHSAFPVVGSDGRPVGLVGLDQVRAVPPDRRAIVTVGEVAEGLADVPVVTPDASGADVLARLTATGARRVLVVDRWGRLVGIVTHTDLVRALQPTVPPPPPPPT